jgi:hypothetical protein
MTLLFTALTCAMVGIAVASGVAGQWAIAVAAGVLAAWLATLAVSSLRRIRR